MGLTGLTGVTNPPFPSQGYARTTTSGAPSMRLPSPLATHVRPGHPTGSVSAAEQVAALS
eukprot:CAMPEP_0173227952 /NCGR_PEP_ID=MMETSP1142-20121109/6251_1 /TAXON_ID=483371 /ORGANISM="non described non described, Strain CCMP2298" /LENGTH=59 /DNA_ID=CAMNT_0014156529 /DNA_START=324 /DNA_END=503 /DNA_ORIENTATION=-